MYNTLYFNSTFRKITISQSNTESLKEIKEIKHTSNILYLRERSEIQNYF